MIKGKIGQGGVGAVYRAFDRSLKRDVAIKRLLSQDDKPEEERRTAELLIREAGMLSKLQHPNIVTVYDVGIDDDGGYVVMELIDGETFDVTISRGALTATDFSQVVDQTLEALIAAQEIDMLHRDIKPSNVMVSWLPSGRFHIKVLDFGLAKLSQVPALQTINHGDAIMGSIYFMAPEQFDREPLDARTDLYSLGCLFYYGLTGKYAFDGNSGPEVMIAHLEHEVKPLAQLRPDLPGELCDWVMRLIAKEMGDRPATASEALERFAPALAAIHSAAQPQVAAAEVQPPAATPSPNRPRLITGPVEQLSSYASPLHTTGYQMRPKKSGPDVASLLIWGAVVLTFAGVAWMILKPDPKSKLDPDVTRNQVGQEPPGADDPQVEPAPITAAPTGNGATAKVLISKGSRWRYLDKGTAPADWFKPSFDGRGWPQGKSPLGFGDPVETELDRGGSGKNGRVAFYFRKSVMVDDPLPADDKFSLEMQVMFDDGFRIFLNGKELVREAMPEGEIGPETFASKKRQSQAESRWETFDFKPSLLNAGQDNLFAVEVHQDSKTSSDIRFSMALKFVEK